MKKLISSGSPFETEIGYSRAVVDGDWVMVSGTTGYNYATMSISDKVEEQAEQCFKNIEEALKKSGASFSDVVRVHYIVPNREDFKRCWPVFKKFFGDIRPACTAICAELIDEAMKIEIEVTARIH